MDAIDRDLAIRTVLAEAANQGPDGMAAVAAVIRNRASAKGGKYGGSSPAEVVTARNQFEPWNDAGKGKPNDPLSYAPGSPKYEQAAQIVDGVFSGAIKDPTGGATHFYAPAAQAALGRKPPSWAKGQQGLKIGDHMFFLPDDPNGLDLSQGMGAVSQTPTTVGSPTQLTGASSTPSAPSSPTNPLLALLSGKGAAPAQSHGFLNQLLFGNGGWQGKLGSAMPNGIFGALGGGPGGGSPGGGSSPLAAMFGLLGGGGASSTGSDPMPQQQAALPPVANPGAPQPPIRPPDLGQGGAPMTLSQLAPTDGRAVAGQDFSNSPMMVMPGGNMQPMGGQPGGGQPSIVDMLKSMFISA